MGSAERLTQMIGSGDPHEVAAEADLRLRVVRLEAGFSTGTKLVSGRSFQTRWEWQTAYSLLPSPGSEDDPPALELHDNKPHVRESYDQLKTLQTDAHTAAKAMVVGTLSILECIAPPEGFAVVSWAEQAEVFAQEIASQAVRVAYVAGFAPGRYTRVLIPKETQSERSETVSDGQAIARALVNQVLEANAVIYPLDGQWTDHIDSRAWYKGFRRLPDSMGEDVDYGVDLGIPEEVAKRIVHERVNTRRAMDTWLAGRGKHEATGSSRVADETIEAILQQYRETTDDRIDPDIVDRAAAAMKNAQDPEEARLRGAEVVDRYLAAYDRLTRSYPGVKEEYISVAARRRASSKYLLALIKGPLDQGAD